MHDGEKSNWQGKLFSESCDILIRELGYSTVFSGRNGIDVVANPPLGWDSQNKTPLLRPFFSPKGITAFLTTSAFRVGTSVEPLISEITKKINNIKKYRIDGGVIVLNVRTPENILKSAVSKNIFVWDYRYTIFLSNKISILNIFSKTGPTIEKIITDDITYLQCFEKSKDIFKAKIALFFNDPLRDIDIDDLESSIRAINEKMITDGLFPISINISVHSAGFLRKDICDQVNKIFKKFSNDNVAYTVPEQPIVEYNVSPFLSNYFLSKSL